MSKPEHHKHQLDWSFLHTYLNKLVHWLTEDFYLSVPHAIDYALTVFAPTEDEQRDQAMELLPALRRSQPGQVLSETEVLTQLQAFQEDLLFLKTNQSARLAFLQRKISRLQYDADDVRPPYHSIQIRKIDQALLSRARQEYPKAVTTDLTPQTLELIVMYFYVFTLFNPMSLHIVKSILGQDY